MFRGKVKHIHFVGIGGIGMSGIAEVLLNMGFKITGSDLKESDTTKRLKLLGANIYQPGHKKEYIEGADVLVVSSAIKKDNPEVVAAKEKGIPVIRRAEMLAELMKLKDGVAIAGSHGKTTTTSLIATVLYHAGLDPTVITGGKLNAFGSNAKLGQGQIIVAEADESDGSFLKLSPTWVVVTNIDPEHLDHYGSMENLKKSFIEFINKIPFYGLASICIDHPGVQSIIPFIERRFVTYGLSSLANWRAIEIDQKGLLMEFSVLYNGRIKGRIRLKQPGIHNVLNALACISIADEIGIEFETIKEGLELFEGVQRRFTIKGSENGITVIDDYGHHPEEIKATLKAVRGCYKQSRIVVIFQPHRYSRTKLLFEQFCNAFNYCDLLFVTEIYPAGEDPIEGVSGRKLSEGIKLHGHRNVVYIEKQEEIATEVIKLLREGDIVLTLGAGDIWKQGEEILRLLRKKRDEQE